MIFSFFAKAQAPAPTITHKWMMTSKTIVKDSTGTVIKYEVWQKMLASGKYSMRPVDFQRDDTEFLIVDRNSMHMVKEVSKPAEANASVNKAAPPVDMSMPPNSIFFNTGEKISSFSANDINGKKIKLKDLKGKIVVLNFWFIGCPPCRAEIPELNELALSYANNPDVVFVAVGLDEKNDIEKFVKDHPFAYQIIEDGRMYADMYKIYLYPTNVVIDREGKVRFHSSGYPATTPYWIKKTIGEISKEKVLN